MNSTRLATSGHVSDASCSIRPIACDVFISEATFGLPVFRHPPAGEEIKKLLRSVEMFPERTHLVGAYAFIGGYSVITKDALPYGRTVGSRPARVFGLNLIGLKRRGFADDTLKKLRSAYRYLTQSKLNTSQATSRIEQDASLKCREVDNLVEFIRTASRGVILRRGGKKSDDSAEE